MPIDLPVVSVVGVYLLAMVPHVTKLAVAYRVQGVLKYNNETPRETRWDQVDAAKVTNMAGFLQRCTGAHLNGMEAAAMYGVGIALCKAADIPDAHVMPLAQTFLATRVMYTAAYMGGYNQAISYLRTALFFGGVYSVGGLYHLAATAPSVASEIMLSGA